MTARRYARVLPAALLAVALTSCGSDSGDEASDDVEVLSADQVAEALLTVDNLGDQFVENKEEDEDSGGFGCLAPLEDLDEMEAEEQDDIDYELKGELGSPAVASNVATFASEDEAQAVLDQLEEDLADCTTVEETDEEGTTIELTVEPLDDDEITSDVDSQLNFSAAGSVSSQGGFNFPIGLWFSLARVDNNLTMVGVSELGEGAAELVEPYSEIAVDRLVAVAAGEEPEATTAPAPPPADIS